MKVSGIALQMKGYSPETNSAIYMHTMSIEILCSTAANSIEAETALYILTLS